jgi:hypothetical protein
VGWRHLLDVGTRDARKQGVDLVKESNHGGHRYADTLADQALSIRTESSPFSFPALVRPVLK